MKSSVETIQNQVIELLKDAKEEENKNNWNAALDLLNKADELVKSEDLRELKGRILYRLGRNHHLAGDSAKTKEGVLNNYQLAIESYQNAKKIFEDLNNKEVVHRLDGFINLLTYIFGLGKGREIESLESAKEHFKQAKLIHQKNGETLESIKMEIMETRTYSLLICELAARLDEKVDFRKIIAEFDNLVVKIIEDLRKKPKIGDYYLHRFLVCMGYCFHWIGVYVSYDVIDIVQQLFTYLDRHGEIINIIDSTEEYSTYYESRFYAYVIFASFNLIMGAYYTETQFEIISLYRKAKTWHKRAEELFSEKRFNTSLSTYHVLRYSISISMIVLGYSSSDFKNVLQILMDTIDQFFLFYPKPIAAQSITASCVAFVVGGVDETKIELQRLEFANRIMDIIGYGEKDIPMLSDSAYKGYNFFKDMELCTAYAIFAELSEDQNEGLKYLQKARSLFEKITDFSEHRTINNQAFFMFCHCASRIGVVLARNTGKVSEKERLYRMAINLLEKAIEMPFNFHRYDNMFYLGKTYHELGRFLNSEEVLKQSYMAYMKAIEFAKARGFYSLVGSGYVYLAQLEDRLGNYISAAENYQKAIDSFDQALLVFTFMNLGKTIEKTKDYLNAWKLIEIAKSYHAKEDHVNARLCYDQASAILQTLREYRFEASFYIAWSELERAEELSKHNEHQEAAVSYEKARTHFQETIDVLNKYSKRSSSPDDTQRISMLIQVAKVRDSYCQARALIETARLESLGGEHLKAAEIYNKASIIFENLCQVYRIKKERDELTAVYYLCKAWENLEKGEVQQDAALHAAASELFLKASNKTNEGKTKKLSLGNSLYCSALECGVKFDNSLSMMEKMENYKKIKMYLRESAKQYQTGGFEHDAKWALATSTFFDGAWHLILSDNEVNIAQKNQYLNVAVNYLKSALRLFDEVGSGQRKKTIQDYLEMINAEKAILTSALDVIEKPKFSGSSIGITAPACPVEVSSPLNLEEMKRQDMQAESELNWQKRMHHLYLYVPEGGICIYDHLFQTGEVTDDSCSAGLASATLSGISMIIQEITKKETKLKILEQEDATILLEYGKYLEGAIIVDENLMTIRKKLKELIDEVEGFYEEELEKFKGDVRPFTKINKFVEKIFETT